MKLTLLSQNEISTLSLPEKCSGHYWIRSRNEDGKQIDIISVEALRATEAGEEDKWMIRSNRRFVIVDKDGKAIPSMAISLLSLYRIRSVDGQKQFTLFPEQFTLDRKQYSGYIVLDGNAEITIGRNENNGICYSNSFTSDTHASITFSANGVFVKDLGSTNHTFVNGKSVQQQQLFIGDVVYIMGLQVIITKNGLFMNNPDGKVKIHSTALQMFRAPSFNDNANNDEDFEEVTPEHYYRAPRFKHDVDVYELKVDAPPNPQNNDEMPMVMLIGPSMTMGMASVASGIFTITSAIERGNLSSAIPSMVMCVSMLLGTLMWPIVTKFYQKRMRIRKEAKRQETYTAYLDQLEQMAAQETTRQEEILRANDVNTESCAARILSPTPRIWERTPKHTDFLSLRLGFGNLPLKANIQYSERKFTVERDELTEMMYNFGEQKRWLTNVPVCLPLVDKFISGIYGDKNNLYSYARSLILQIVTLHSYDEVKIVLLYDESRAEDFSFARWLPHTMNNERTIRYIATNSDEAKELSGSLDSIIEYRKNMPANKLDDEDPYFVVICLDKDLASKTECVRRILEHKTNLKFSVLSIYERLVDLPKECMAVAEIGNGTGNLTINDDVSELSFKIDAPQRIDIGSITNVLANTFVDITGSDFTLPKKYTFFEMLDIGMIEHLNIAENWALNDPTKSLAATIGIDKYGEPFRLDLHERAHGPHGLVAGMTGSGKSEFIISYILSMAVNFHPYEVAFILIDYKGGGMAKSFENIPHTAGVITNLDGNGIKRSLASMRSELHRREKIFRDTSIKHNVSNIDIYKYQKLYREGKVSEPLPHLFIISDEFAELKKEQPDFMTELTSTARVGRSLGVHLILATQKPGGVVDDQIRSNSRFKVCLKVQDSGDSQEMLGRPEAAALVDTGRFYLQVGYNELFEIGQSAWAGAPYYPSPKTIKERDDAVSVINTNGRVIAEANTNRFANVVDPPKQLDVITNYIAKYCEEEKINRWKMWLDPIKPLIYVDKLAEKYKGTAVGKYELNPIVGEFDDPAHQRQDVLRVPLTAEGNAIVYGSAGSGKAMFLEAMCYSLMREHRPSEVNIYIMDFGAETFTAFAESPFIGDVILSYETEKVNNLFKLMAEKLKKRKKILSGFGGTLAQYNMQAEEPEPNIVVMINNFAAFNELFEDRTGDLGYLTREGTKYGVYFVLACTGVNNVRFGMLQNFKLLYCLQMNNPDDYSSVVGRTEGLCPEKFKGRGIFRINKDTLVEFQTASIVEADMPYPAIRSYCTKLAQMYSEYRIQRVPVLPQKVTEEFLEPHIEEGDLSRIPVGVEKDSCEISYYDFSSVVNLVISENQEWYDFSNKLALMVAEKCRINTIVLSPIGGTSGETEYLRFCGSAEDCGKAAYDVYNIIRTRNNEYKTMTRNGEQPKTYEPLFVVIRSMDLLKKILEQYEPSGEQIIIEDIKKLGGLFKSLQFMMSKCLKEYNVHFLVCENADMLNSFAIEKWCVTHISWNDGLWVGNGISSQYKLKINKKPKEFSADVESDFGFVIKHSAAVMVKFLQ